MVGKLYFESFNSLPCQLHDTVRAGWGGKSGPSRCTLAFTGHDTKSIVTTFMSDYLTARLL